MRDLSVTWRRLEDDGYLPYDLVNNLIQSAELHKIEDSFQARMVSSNYFYVPFINYNLRKKGRLLGHLFVINMFQEVTPEDIELVSLVGNYVTQSILNNPRYQNERGKLYEYFLNDIFSGRIKDADNIKKQLTALGYRETNFHIIAVIYSTEKDELRYERILSHLERFRGCKPFHYNTYIAAIIPFRKDDTLDHIVCAFKQIAESMQIQAGISDLFLGFSAIYHCALQACQALEYLLSSNKANEHVCSYSDCFFTDFKEKCLNNSSFDYMFPAELSALKEYDQIYGSELLYTLKVYLEHERNTIDTAKELFIHRNTLNYRIRKIQELFPINLQDPVTRIRILLYFMIFDHHHVS